MNRNFIIIPDGFRFIAPLALISGLALYFQANTLAILLICFTLFTIWFFRNPQRDIPTGDNAVVSPADGLVIKVEEIDETELLNTKCKRICIFMNVLNVHVNRNACAGVVKTIRYYPGKYLVANLEKASLLNERNAMVIEHKSGKSILVVQIAGLIARRIVCWLKEGQEVVKGERFGLIRFGSRLDIYLPLCTEVKVKVGDKVKAGSSIIGEII
ncbi:MAG: phosphatidylserine decarboxylase family protein [Deltaproteobacteria bacterium]